MELGLKVKRVVIKFLVHVGKTNAEIKTMLLSVYGVPMRSQLFEWVGQFQEERESVFDDVPEEWPRTAHVRSVVEQITTKVDKDRRQTLRDVASSIGLTRENVHAVLKQELHMSKVSPHLVPKLLTEEQKAERVHTAQDCLRKEETDSILEHTITGDESWVFEYELVKKCASMVWLPSDKRISKKLGTANQKSKRILSVSSNGKVSCLSTGFQRAR